METPLISDAAVNDALSYPALITALRDAFASYATGRTQMPAKTYVDLPEHNGDFRSMPAHVKTDDWEGAGVKWVNVHPENKENPTVMATVIYNDPATGAPLAVLEGTTLTAMRTGAVAALATDELAIENASSLGLIGAGRQAHEQLAAISTVRDIDTVVIHDADASAAEDFCETYAVSNYDVVVDDLPQAASCDVVSTTTPVETPIVARSDLAPHTHVNAMGADAAGKQELDPQILRDAQVYIDDWEQATHSGEVNVPYSEGALTDSDIEGTLGEVVAGLASVSVDASDLTVFDSTGLAIQDITAAHLVVDS